MIKKVGVKKNIVLRKIPKVIKKTIVPPTKSQTEKILIENFIALQKVITNLSIKFDKLTNQISSLLELFEVSAKTLAEKDFDIKKENRDNKQIIEKIDNLLEQNKIIARGVTLVHEGNPEHKPIFPPQRVMQNSEHRSISPPQRVMQNLSAQEASKYQQSISQRSPQSTEFKQLKKD